MINQLPLPIIRIGLLSGIIVFGVVAYFLSGDLASPDEQLGEMLKLVFVALTAVSLIASAVISRKVKNTEASGSHFLLAGWALAEAPALLGGIIWLLTGQAIYFVLGAILFAVTMFFILPIGGDG